MNRTIWIFRMVALLILLVFTLLMWSLYSRLHEIRDQQPPSPQATTAPDEPGN